MFSKPVAFGLLALGCLTAAAGGAYVATRHNAADATHRPPVAAPARSGSQGQGVAETEATVAPKPDPAPTPAPPATDNPPNVSVTTRETRAPVESAKPGVVKRPERTKPLVNARKADANGAAASDGTAVSTPPAMPPAAPTVDPPRAPEPVPSRTEPEAARLPQFEEVVVPASAVIGLQVQTPLSSERARVEDRVEARVTRDVHAGDRLAIPAGSRVIGSVTLVEKGGKMKDRARLGIRFHTLVLADGSEIQLHTEPIIREGESPTGDSAKKIGGAAVGGAILGAILGGGKGAAIGSAVGAGGGAAAVMAGDRNAATLPSGAIVTARLSAPVTIQVEKRED